jgi:hypothetical protein
MKRLFRSSITTLKKQHVDVDNVDAVGVFDLRVGIASDG